MTSDEILRARAALTALHRLGNGLTSDALCCFTETACGRRMTATERALFVDALESRKWISSYRNAFTDQILYTITDEGRVALAGLGPLEA